MKKFYIFYASSAILLCMIFSALAQDKPISKIEPNAKKRYEIYKNLALAQRKGNVSQEEKNKTADLLGQALEDLAGAEKITEKERLTYLFQAAGTCGLRKDFPLMNKKIEEALKKFEGLDLISKVEAFQDAALLYMSIRDYEVVQALKSRGDAMLETARVRNTYLCHFIPDTPVGVGGWAASDFIKDPKNKDSRFQPYPRSGDMLKDDVAAVRPVAEKDKAALLDRETSFAMAYDVKGWYIYIQSNEPDVEQVMTENGRLGSSLEMFFAPGLEGETYYQWIIGLATGEVNLYHWNTPSRSYRYLENKLGSFQSETAVLKKGWGTEVFIPWECLYDKLPFIEGNGDTWRFSIMRWGPVSLTWGGRVHETGRWGQIHWQAPTQEQRLAIEKNIIKRAWHRYQSTKSSLAEYWQGDRGDMTFYRDVFEPVIKDYDQHGEKMKDVDNWDAKAIDEVFRKNVPDWMEFKYKAEELRTEYLAEKMFADK